jgi:hypothetical protein
MTLRTRNDRCRALPDSNDWIIDYPVQQDVRSLVDLRIANARA